MARNEGQTEIRSNHYQMGLHRYFYFQQKKILTKSPTPIPENYVHEDSYAMSSSHFGKKQSTLLVAVVFYKESVEVDGVTKPRLAKKYYDFVSEYLGHNNVFYNKCMRMLLDQLKDDDVLPFDFSKLYNVTDGGSHFASRYAYWDLGKTSRNNSKSK